MRFTHLPKARELRGVALDAIDGGFVLSQGCQVDFRLLLPLLGTQAGQVGVADKHRGEQRENDQSRGWMEGAVCVLGWRGYGDSVRDRFVRAYRLRHRAG